MPPTSDQGRRPNRRANRLSGSPAETTSSSCQPAAPAPVSPLICDASANRRHKQNHRRFNRCKSYAEDVGNRKPHRRLTEICNADYLQCGRGIEWLRRRLSGRFASKARLSFALALCTCDEAVHRVRGRPKVVPAERDPVRRRARGGQLCSSPVVIHTVPAEKKPASCRSVPGRRRRPAEWRSSRMMSGANLVKVKRYIGDAVRTHERLGS